MNVYVYTHMCTHVCVSTNGGGACAHVYSYV